MTAAESAGLIAPHGGSLVNLAVPAAERESLLAGVSRRIECSDRNALLGHGVAVADGNGVVF